MKDIVTKMKDVASKVKDVASNKNDDGKQGSTNHTVQKSEDVRSGNISVRDLGPDDSNGHGGARSSDLGPGNRPRSDGPRTGNGVGAAGSGYAAGDKKDSHRDHQIVEARKPKQPVSNDPVAKLARLKKFVDEQRGFLLRAISAARPGNRGRIMMKKINKLKGDLGVLQLRIFEMEREIALRPVQGNVKLGRRQ